jgi:hypothetical protein
MSRRRSFSRGPAAIRRGKPHFPLSGKTFLIVTEGEKTEPNYLLALRNRLRLATADVEVRHPEGTDPLTLTRAAIQIRDDRKKLAKKDLGIADDEVWVVFDLERPHDQRRKLAVEAMKLMEAAGIHFAWSDPCFEFWLLLHEEYTTAHFADCGRVVKKLERHLENYSKGPSPTIEFLEKIPIAVTHAEGCRKHHKTSGDDGNPSTQVDILVRQLNSATRRHFQFKLG